jgi:hypothetical protein
VTAAKEFIVLADDHKTVLKALIRADHCSLILEEVAATATLSLERTWYAVLELIELRFMTPAGISLYCLTAQGKEAARRLVA